MNLKEKLGKGISPQSFINGMTCNREKLLNLQQRFTWKSSDEKRILSSFRGCNNWRCFILCTDWCPDVIYNVPALLQVLEHSGVVTEILPMEQHLDTMDRFMTDGGRAQPMAVFTDTDGEVLGVWGPRPQYIQSVMTAFRQENPDRSTTDYQDKLTHVRQEIASLYEQGMEYQHVIVKELLALLTSFDRSDRGGHV